MRSALLRTVRVCVAALLPVVALGLRLPIIHTRASVLPLDRVHLQLDEDSYNELGVKATGRSLVGLLHTPRGETSAPEGTCGVICEIADAGSLAEDGLFVVRADAFSRFRVRSSVDGFAPVPIVDADPWVDSQPEDDERLRETHGLTERRTALSALELRCHLTYGNVKQLLEWNGPSKVGFSARLGLLEDSERAEVYRAVERFAPLSAETRAAADDEEFCPLDYGDDDEEDEEGDEESRAAWEVCALERTYLHACVEPRCSYEDGSAGPTGRLDARDLTDFQMTRAELYSFALCRLHDFSPEDAAVLLEGRSTAARLASADEALLATRTWLGSRLGIDLQSTTPAARPAWRWPWRAEGTVPQRVPERAYGRKRPLALRTRWRRMLRRTFGDDVRQFRAQQSTETEPARDGWEVMQDGAFDF